MTFQLWELISFIILIFKRGEDVCATWYTDVLFFIIDDVPEFFEETVPKAFIDLGDEIVDLGESTWDVVVDFNNRMFVNIVID